MTDVSIYFSVNNINLIIVVITNGEREFYTADNVSIDFKAKLIKFDTEMYVRRIVFDNIAIAHDAKEQIKLNSMMKDKFNKVKTYFEDNYGKVLLLVISIFIFNCLFSC